MIDYEMVVEDVAFMGRSLVLTGRPSACPARGKALLVKDGFASIEVGIVGVERYAIAWADGQPAGLLLRERLPRERLIGSRVIRTRSR